MKRVRVALLYIISVAFVAALVSRVGYPLSRAILIALAFFPAPLISARSLTEIYWASVTRRIIVTTCLCIAGICLTLLLIILLHFFAFTPSTDRYIFLTINPFLLHPAIIGLVEVPLILGSIWAWRLTGCQKAKRVISFVSERRRIEIPLQEILYLESNDKEVLLHAEGGAVYRNRTQISHWEKQLGSDFIRIHRSFLVRTTSVTQKERDAVWVGKARLPISRKYRDATELSIGMH